MKTFKLHEEGDRGVSWRGGIGILVGASLALALVVLGLGQGQAQLASLPGSNPDPIEREPPQLNAAAAQHADLVEACSAEFRRRNAQEVEEDKAAPALIQWGCKGIEKCPGHVVWQMLASYIQRQLKEFLELVPCDLYRLIQGRAIWIVGDSNAQHFYRQLRCFLSPFLERMPAGQEPRQDTPITQDSAEREAIKKSILKHYDGGVDVPICTHYVGNTRVCHIRVNFAHHFVEAYLPNLRLLNISLSDTMVFNMGLWHHKRPTGYGEGDYGEEVRKVAKYIAANRSQLPTMVWRDNPPQHFDIEDGYYPQPDEAPKLLPWPWKCVALADVMLLHDGSLWGKNDRAKRGGWRNMFTDPIMAEARIPVLRTWNESAVLWDMHTQTECSHWCAPGAHSVWIWKLWEVLRSLS